VDTRAGVPVSGTKRRSQHTALDLHDVHVLIVDDEPDARDLLRGMLEGTGARISEASSAEEALERVKRDPPDILLGDVAMPSLDGYAMMRRIRDLPGFDRIHALAVSTYARPEDEERAVEAGFNGHLSKPVQPVALYGALERAREERPSRSSAG
jgi:CheY-like chemotaxis protein